MKTAGAHSISCRDYFRLLDILPDSVIVINAPDSRVLYWNHEAEALYGWSASEALGRVIDSMTGPVGRPENSAKPLNTERMCARKDRSPIVVEGKSLITNVSDLSAPVIVTIDRDITSKKKMEEELRKSEEHFRVACEGSGAGTWQRDVATGDEVWSERYFELYGINSDTCKPSFENWLAAVHPDDRHFVLEDQRRMQDGKIERLSNEFRILHPSGVRWIHECGRNFYSEDGALTFMIGIALDITERKIVEEQLKEADLRKNRFIATLSHELRNPLAAIQGALKFKGSAASIRTEEIIERQLKHIEVLIGDLLDMSRVLYGKVRLDKQRLDLEEVLRQVVNQMRLSGRIQNRMIAMQFGAAIPCVDADPCRVEQIFSNLLDNSCKCTSDTGTILVRCRSEDGWVVVEIVDDGIGLAPDTTSTIFDPFRQADERRNGGKDGLGIGLMVVKYLVEMHGGQISAASAGLGKGSTFRVSFPNCSEPEKEVPQVSAAGDAACR